MYVSTVFPSDGAIEVVGILVDVPLCAVEHSLERAVALPPYLRVDVAVGCYPVQVGEVDLENAVALRTAQSELNHHLVGDVLCLGGYAAQPLCADVGDAHYHCCDSYYKPFHNLCF